MSASTSLPGIYVSESFMDIIQWFPFVYHFERRQLVKWLYENHLPNAPRSEVMLAPADFHGVDFKELFKTASVPALRCWLQFRSLVNSASCKSRSYCYIAICILVESCGQCGTTGDDPVSGLLLPRAFIGNKQDPSACCLTAAAADTLLLKL